MSCALAARHELVVQSHCASTTFVVQPISKWSFVRASCTSAAQGGISMGFAGRVMICKLQKDSRGERFDHCWPGRRKYLDQNYTPKLHPTGLIQPTAMKPDMGATACVWGAHLPSFPAAECEFMRRCSPICGLSFRSWRGSG